MRLIDADALIEFVEGRYTVTWNHDYDGGIKDACIDILNFIDNAPTIDAVPVVRCKDCKWLYQNQHLDVYCIHPHGMGYGIGDDWYCHHGERKDDE